MTWPYSSPRLMSDRLFSNTADFAHVAALAGPALRQCVTLHYAELRALPWRALLCAPSAKIYQSPMIYKRLLSGEPSVTITNFRKAMIIHPKQNRLLSVREAARIQTFPDKFKFAGGISSQQQQVSDAVPVLLAKAVGGAVLEYVQGLRA